MEIPADVYWGIHTARALDQLPDHAPRDLATTPTWCARSRASSRRPRAPTPRSACSTPRRPTIIDDVCERIVAGELHDQFVVGVIQGGAGTSTNMNTNEVIANAGLEAMGTAVRRLLATCTRSTTSTAASRRTTSTRPRSSSRWCSACSACSTSTRCSPRRSRPRAASSRTILKVGRTQLQDAVPMTLGQEFIGFAHTLQEDYDRLAEVDHVAQRDQHGRHGDRHRHHRRPALRRGGAQAPRRASPASRRRPRPT